MGTREEDVHLFHIHVGPADGPDALRGVHRAHGPAHQEKILLRVNRQHPRDFELRLRHQAVVPIELQHPVLADEGEVPVTPVRFHRDVVRLGILGESQLLEVDARHLLQRGHVHHGDLGVALNGHIQEIALLGVERPRCHGCEHQSENGHRAPNELLHTPPHGNSSGVEFIDSPGTAPGPCGVGRPCEEGGGAVAPPPFLLTVIRPKRSEPQGLVPWA